jgi:hypothetical protein
MNKSIRIKSESRPSRCDICHQTDLFDAIRNYCQRCAQLKLVLMPLESHISDDEFKRIERTIRRFLIFIALIGAVVMLVISSIFMLSNATLQQDRFEITYTNLAIVGGLFTYLLLLSGAGNLAASTELRESLKEMSSRFIYKISRVLVF